MTKREPTEMKMYTRDEVLEAMYDLRRQGFKKVTAMILMDGTLCLACNNHNLIEEPHISIDAIDCWYENDLEDPLLGPAKTAGITDYDYWWIFD